MQKELLKMMDHDTEIVFNNYIKENQLHQMNSPLNKSIKHHPGGLYRLGSNNKQSLTSIMDYNQNKNNIGMSQIDVNDGYTSQKIHHQDRSASSNNNSQDLSSARNSINNGFLNRGHNLQQIGVLSTTPALITPRQNQIQSSINTSLSIN